MQRTITDNNMKKKYIKPELLIIKFTPINIVAGSPSDTTVDENPGDFEADGDARENNIFDNNHSIWDNAW